MSLYKAGIIGLGQAGWKFEKDNWREGIWTHNKAYDYSNDVEVWSVYDSDKQSLKEYPYYTYNNKCTSIKELMETGVDIVSVCTPTKTHYEVIKEVLQYPLKAIYCEKPLAFTSKECNELVKLCKANDVILAVNYMRRWDNLYLEIKKMIDTKFLGELKSVIGYTNTALYMSASHMIDLIIMLCGDIVCTDGFVDKSFVRKVHGENDYGGVFHFETYSNVLGTLYAYCSDIKNYQFELDLQFSNGRIRSAYDGKDNTFQVYQPSSNRTPFYELSTPIPISYDKNERMVDAVEDIIRNIEKWEGCNKVNCSGEDAIKSIKFIEECLTYVL